MKDFNTDVLIIGTGISGLATAIKLAENKVNVTIVTREKRPEITNTFWAQGGIIYSPKDLNDQEDLIQDISFLGSGCAISKASASLMTTALKNKTTKDAFNFFDKFVQMVTGKNSESSHLENLGKLQVFKGVKEFPVRVKCASLPWHTLVAAIQEKKGKISTE